MEQPKKKRGRPRKTEQYFDSDVFDALWTKWKKGDDQAGNQAALMLYDLHEHILQHANFRGYSQEIKEELVQTSMMTMFRNGFKKFDPSKGKWFSYLSRAAFQNFYSWLLRYYRKLNNGQEYVKHTLMQLDSQGKPDLERFIQNYKTSNAEGEE